MKSSRSVISSIAGGTATATLQMPKSGRVVGVLFSVVTAAAGTWELSKSSTSQIATTAPDVSVLARVRIAATAGHQNVFIPIEFAVKVLDNLFLHCTGAGNVGEIVLYLN